ncbi:MAG: PhzF family phenazine biosynthesis protein [Armatimonadetes bacterium]|nr:PhzF family phenazine biosynthesis protein [Armatimonadota bacterium]
MPLFIVDAFAERAFAGNPAGVCLLDEPRDGWWMQNVAAEMNLSETAFLAPSESGFDLRWFTPVIEVDLCGHATLASAHVLWETGRLPIAARAIFHTLSGLLTAERSGDLIEMDFPSEPAEECAAPAILAKSLGAEPVRVAKNRMDYLVELESEERVRGLQPDFAKVAQVDARGVIVTSASDSPEFDFVSRFFGPQSGVAEDPVTGSAHCCLGPYWGEKLGKSELTGLQVSKRGGVVRVRLMGERVALGGRAVTVFKGHLLV